MEALKFGAYFMKTTTCACLIQKNKNTAVCVVIKKTMKNTSDDCFYIWLLSANKLI